VIIRIYQKLIEYLSNFTLQIRLRWQVNWEELENIIGLKDLGHTDLEREWKNELVEKFWQIEEEREENHWHHKDLNIFYIKVLFVFWKKL
jgi:hypothetical protein